MTGKESVSPPRWAGGGTCERDAEPGRVADFGRDPRAPLDGRLTSPTYSEGKLSRLPGLGASPSHGPGWLSLRPGLAPRSAPSADGGLTGD